MVSMLPGDWHVPLAEKAIARKAHFVSSSYIAPEMRALDDAARDAGVTLVNEVGLDPGIDHLMAHALVADYRNSAAFDPKNEISFISFCGGVPKHANAVPVQIQLVALGCSQGAAIPVPVDPRFFGIACEPPMGCNYGLHRASADARKF